MLATAGQVACCAAFAVSIFLWAWAEVFSKACKGRRKSNVVEAEAADKLLATAETGAEKVAPEDRPVAYFDNAFWRCLKLENQALHDAKPTLRIIVEFGLLMVWFYVADRTEVFQEQNKEYSRDLLTFLYSLLTAVAFGVSLKKARNSSLLNRDQTEEWKGWMQVLFLLYHYFEAKEIYNAIRVFIAAYVWMTGYGNFHYYYKTGDFSIGRFCQMMWRLNFLVFFACVILQNSYMLYYICPMHTLYTVLVYASLGIANQYNKSNVGLLCKVIGALGMVVLCWDVKPVFYAIWKPFNFLMGYTDPRKPGPDSLHEWYFRSSLDRYVWIHGMLCAFLHPYCDKALQWLATAPVRTRAIIKTAIITLTLTAGYLWVEYVFLLPKVQYNQLHPYTSWIPITLWIILRNILPEMRQYSLGLYSWLGIITLETYIGQFHIWMKTDIPDGQPKSLLTLVPGYPLLNFTVTTAVYVVVSRRLFTITNMLKEKLVPHDNNRELLRNAVLMASAGLALYVASTVVKGVFAAV